MNIKGKYLFNTSCSVENVMVGVKSAPTRINTKDNKFNTIYDVRKLIFKIVFI